MSRLDPPRAGDQVYDERRIDRGLQPNGYIKSVNRSAGEVWVRFHDAVFSRHTEVSMKLEEFEVQNGHRQWAFFV